MTASCFPRHSPIAIPNEKRGSMTIPTTVSVAPADEYPADGHTMTDKLTATLDKAGVRAISTDLWGIFFEDISYSGDGGLNADLVQNGAFEYNRADSIDWSNYSFWRKIVPEARSPRSASMTTTRSHRKPALRDGGSRTRPCRAGQHRLGRHGVPRRRNLRFHRLDARAIGKRDAGDGLAARRRRQHHRRKHHHRLSLGMDDIPSLADRS